jgi:RND family efflux transporter MFP subunit
MLSIRQDHLSKVLNFAGLWLLACGMHGEACAQTPDRNQAVVGVGCTMLAYRAIEVRSPVSGLLESVPVSRGQAVRKGAVVATLESSAERSAVWVAQHRATMVGTVDSGQARVDLLGRKYERRKALADEQALSLQDRDDADLERRLAAAELKQAQENRELARRELKQAEDQLERRTIRSPVDGLVVDQYIQVGELVDPSDAKKPIVRLIQYDPLRVEVMAPVSQFGKVKVGDTVTILPEAPIGGRISARVRLVDRMLDPSSGMFGVRLEVPNPALTIPPGLGCKVVW